MEKEETITITKKEYDRLMHNDEWLHCLETAGVNNWDGINEAYKFMEAPPDNDYPV